MYNARQNLGTNFGKKNKFGIVIKSEKEYIDFQSKLIYEWKQNRSIGFIEIPIEFVDNITQFQGGGKDEDFALQTELSDLYETEKMANIDLNKLNSQLLGTVFANIDQMNQALDQYQGMIYPYYLRLVELFPDYEERFREQLLYNMSSIEEELFKKYNVSGVPHRFKEAVSVYFGNKIKHRTSKRV